MREVWRIRSGLPSLWSMPSLDPSTPHRGSLPQWVDVPRRKPVDVAHLGPGWGTFCRQCRRNRQTPAGSSRGRSSPGTADSQCRDGGSRIGRCNLGFGDSRVGVTSPRHCVHIDSGVRYGIHTPSAAMMAPSTIVRRNGESARATLGGSGSPLGTVTVTGCPAASRDQNVAGTTAMFCSGPP